VVLRIHLKWTSFESEEMNSTYRKTLDSSRQKEGRGSKSNGNSPKIPIISSYKPQNIALSKLPKKCSNVK